MRTTIRNIAAGAALITAISLAPVGASAFMGEDGHPMAGQHFKRMATELGLTAQQRQDIKAIFQKDRAQFLPLLQQLANEHRSLRSLVHADTVDDAAIRAQAAKVATIQADVAVQRAHMGQEIRALLTPEQIQKLKELRAKREERRDRAGIRALKRIEQGK